MKLNIEKSVFQRCSRNKAPMLTSYSINNKALAQGQIQDLVKGVLNLHSSG